MKKFELTIILIILVPFLAYSNIWADPDFEQSVKDAGLICTGVVIKSSPKNTTIRIIKVFKGSPKSGEIVTISRAAVIGIGHEYDKLKVGENFFFIVKTHKKGYIAFTDSYWSFHLNDSSISIPIRDPSAYITINRTHFESFLNLLVHGGSIAKSTNWVDERMADIALLEPLTRSVKEVDIQIFTLEILYYFGKPIYAPSIIRFLESPYYQVRWSCVRALATCGSSLGKSAIVNQLKNEENDNVQSALGKAIFQLNILEARPILESRIPEVSNDDSRLMTDIMSPISNTMPPARYSYAAALMRINGLKGTYDELISKSREYITNNTNIKLHILENKKPFYSIEDALKKPDSVFILVLDNRELTELPAEVQKFKNLKSLSVYKNKLKRLPGFLEDLGLLELNIGNNEIVDIPDIIFSCSTLERLDIGGNSINKIPAIVSNLINIKQLNLRMNDLDSLPNEMIKLGKLELIDLYGNDFYRFPEILGHCPSLKTILIGSNNIKKLPLGLSNPSKLNYIDLSYNELSTKERRNSAQLPIQIIVNTETYEDRYYSVVEAIENNKHAKVIHDNHNDFSDIQLDLSSLKSVEFLVLTDNKIFQFPRGLASLTNLKSLVLHHNNIEKLPSDINQMKSLTRLDLSFNRLKELPLAIKELPLKYLNLSNNELNDTEKKLIESWFKGKCNVIF